MSTRAATGPSATSAPAEEKAQLLRRSTSRGGSSSSSHHSSPTRTTDSDQQHQLSSTNTTTTTNKESPPHKSPKMAHVYHQKEQGGGGHHPYQDSDNEGHGGGGNQGGGGGESTRFGPITETILTTLSQDNLFLICLLFVELLGVILVILATCWMLQIGGLGFADKLIFNFHPILMTLGMIFLNANGILIYRSTRTLGYQAQKRLHFALQTAMISTSWLGFLAAYLSHAWLSIPHFYSLHSWLGLAALTGVTISLVSSYLTFLYPKANPIYRRLSLPFHVFGGIANIALSAGIAVAGITEKAIFSLNKADAKPEETYAYLPSVAILLNVFGVILVIFTILVVWMVTKPEFKRKYKMTVNTPHYVLRREKTLD